MGKCVSADYIDQLPPYQHVSMYMSRRNDMGSKVFDVSDLF